MSTPPANRGGPPSSTLPLSTPGRPTAAKQVSTPHEFLHYHKPILNGTVSQGTELSHRATADGLARVVDVLQEKLKGMEGQIAATEEDIKNLQTEVKMKKMELEPLDEMLDKWAMMKG